MALVKCKECAATLSSQAASCPQCGAPRPAGRKKTSLLTWLIAGVFGFVVFQAVLMQESRNSTEPVRAPPSAESKQAEADRLRAAQLVLQLRGAAKDPDSFKLHTAYVTNSGAACVEYSATNSFNARLRGIAVVARGKDSIATDAATWNRLCAGAGVTTTDYKNLFTSTLLQAD